MLSNGRGFRERGPEDRALVVEFVAVVVIMGIGGAYVLLTPPQRLPTRLPIREGTTFSRNDTWSWAAYVDVRVPGSRLVGAWTAFDGAGVMTLVVANGSVPAPGGPSLNSCPRAVLWAESNGSIDERGGMGPHTVHWGGGCTGTASKVVVVEAVQLAPVPFM